MGVHARSTMARARTLASGSAPLRRMVTRLDYICRDYICRHLAICMFPSCLRGQRDIAVFTFPESISAARLLPEVGLCGMWRIQPNRLEMSVLRDAPASHLSVWNVHLFLFG